MNNLMEIKNKLMSDGAANIFMDYLPTAVGEHGKKLAKRYAKMVYAYISQNPSLQQCTLASLIRSASQLASVNLEIDARGLAFLVPYKNKGILEAQAQISYLGLMELAYRSEQVKSITANCIYDSELGDVRIIRKDGRYEVTHPFSYQKPTGKIIAVYATAEIEGLGPQTMVLRADEVEKFRSMSKAPNSPAWVEHTEAMYKKTAIRQLAKFLPKSIAKEFSQAAAIDEHEDFVEASAVSESRILDELGSETITDFEETEKPKTKKRGRPKKKEEVSGAYHCNKCNKDFDEPAGQGEKPLCRFCLSADIIENRENNND